MFSRSTVLALAAVVATGTIGNAFTPLSTPSKVSVGVANHNSDYNTFRRPVSFLKSTETEESSNAETYEYVSHIPWMLSCRRVVGFCFFEISVHTFRILSNFFATASFF